MKSGDECRYCCCFTGHRPEKIKRNVDEINMLIEAVVAEAVKEGFTTFISGMARGVDIWAAESVLRLRDKGNSIRLVCASPFEGFEKSWPEEWKSRYYRILKSADEVNYICRGYSAGCFQIRNRWMVDRSSRLIAVYDGGKGGTRNTINYARAQGLDAIII